MGFLVPRALALNAKQQRFVDAYLAHGNAARAAIDAGYSAASAETNGPRLLRNAQVADEISRRQKQAADRADVTAERVVRELAAIAFADLRDVAEWGFGPDEDGQQRAFLRLLPSGMLDAAAAASLQSVRMTDRGVTVKQHDKLRALELLGRHLGMFADKVEVEHSGLGELFEQIWQRAQERTA